MKSSGSCSGSRARTAAAEAVAGERLVWARGDIRGLWEWAKLSDDRGCLQHLGQVEISTLQVAIAIRQSVSKILNLARHQSNNQKSGVLRISVRCEGFMSQSPIFSFAIQSA